MWGLVLKDLFSMRKYLKSLAIAVGILLIMGLCMGEAAFVAGVGGMLSAIVTIVGFSYDESCHWDAYGMTLPVTRRQYIAAKYLMALLMFGVSTLTGMGMTALVELVSGSVLWADVWGSGLGAFLVGPLAFSVLSPCICLLGVERSRLVMMAVFLLPTGLIMLWGRQGGKIPPLSPVLRQALPWLAVLALVVLFVGSYLLSCRIYEKKDL